MFSKAYHPLSQDENAVPESTEKPVRQRKWRTLFVPVLCLSLLSSFILNVMYCTRVIGGSSSIGGTTQFAELSYDTSHVIEYESRFNHPDRAVQDAAWASDLIDPTNLVVALDDSFTESRGILHSMRWPWDSRKGVYTLNIAHELHCMHLLRKTVNQACDGVSPEWPRKHMSHCLAYILQSVMCNADDTPLYQGLLHQNRHAEHPLGGLGQTRTCRNFDKLREWTTQHSACYNASYVPDNLDAPERERYRFCPDDRKPWENVT